MVEFIAGFEGSMVSDIATVMGFLAIGLVIGILMVREEK
jgi:hypothetical protein